MFLVRRLLIVYFVIHYDQSALLGDFLCDFLGSIRLPKFWWQGLGGTVAESGKDQMPVKTMNYPKTSIFPFFVAQWHFPNIILVMVSFFVEEVFSWFVSFII